MSFELHTQLEKDCFLVGDLTLCRLLLMNDKNYPWFILVPKRENKREVYELSEDEQIQLNSESTRLSKILMEGFNGDKMNVAALGNVVPQLHIHHIVRYKNDAAWPGPVWGKIEPIHYTKEEADEIRKRIVDLEKSVSQDI